MSFENDKKVCLNKIDKSVKKSVDKKIKKSVDKINSLDNYYTTSSCSGRIVLLQYNKGKKGSKWLFIKHDIVKFSEIKRIKLNKEVWFKQEPLIVHVCCKTIEDAKKFLKLARRLFKRAGIISLGNKIIIEIIGNEKIDTIIHKDKLLVTENYFKELVKEANNKLKRNFGNIDKLYVILKKLKQNSV